MSAAHTVKGVVAISAIAFLLVPSHAHSQEFQRMPTLADCPAGWTLGVQDTAEPQQMTSSQPPLDNYSVADPAKLAAEKAAQQVEAPRQFITRCIPPF